MSMGSVWCGASPGQRVGDGVVVANENVQGGVRRSSWPMRSRRGSRTLFHRATSAAFTSRDFATLASVSPWATV
jgi:hypothetical protein